MTLRELAQIAMAGRKAAARTGQTFRIDPWKAKAWGVSDADCARVEAACDMIDAYSSEVLARLNEQDARPQPEDKGRR